MNRFEKLKGMEMPDAKKFLMELLGDKAEILFEDLRETVKVMEVEEGSVIKYGGIEWVVLERNLHLNGVLVVAKRCLFDKAFDAENEQNNWAKSPLRKRLNTFGNDDCATTCELYKVNKNDLVEFERDLTTDDGMTEYGTCKDYIPNCEKAHWTITGDNLENSYNVRSVRSGGSLLDDYAWGGDVGVRPLCVLKSDTLVEVNREE